MMFKWPGPPTPKADQHELADFAEMTCWRDSRASATSMSRDLGRLAENDYAQGVPEEDEADSLIEAAYDEIERRREVCRDGYPFLLDRRGSALQVGYDDANPKHVIYKYLLLATRLNMSENRNHAGIDGTRLLERLGAEVAREYLGDRAESFVFGAGVGSGGFEERVNELCRRLEEGGGFVNRDGGRVDAQDDKLDIVAWKPFSDGLHGKLIGFGQCKTGTHYSDSTALLQPDTFVSKWLRDRLVVPPVRMFFVSEALSLNASRFGVSVEAGLLFDRCRIVDFCHGTDSGVVEELREWTTAAASAVELIM